MSSHIIGIVGECEATQEMVAAGLADLRDQADAEGEAFWAVVAVTPDAPEAIQFAMDWLLEEAVAYDLVADPSIADKIDEKYTTGADTVTKTKTVEKKVVDVLLENDAVHLLGLLGDGSQPSKRTMDQVQRFFDVSDEHKVLALDDALGEINFGPDVEDEDGVDLDALGAAADDGDDDAIAKLTELADAAEIDHASMATWSEVAELLKPADEPAPEPAKAAAKKGAAAKAPAKPKGGANLWTEEALEALEAKELKTIAVQAGIPNASKLGHLALKAALLGTDRGGPSAEAEPEPEAEPAKKKATPKKAAAAKAAPAAEAETNDEPTLVDLITTAAAALQAIADHLTS